MRVFIVLFLISYNLYAIELNKLQVTGRLQGSLAATDLNNGEQDFYVRRARVNFKFQVNENEYIYTDVRSDRVNYQDKGEGEFKIGDFYWNYNLNENLNIHLLRSKVDVSYSQTSSSKNLVNPDRAFIADFASSFISEARRASNIQLNGDYKNWQFQIVLGDGVQSSALKDLANNSIDEILNQKLIYGGKVRYFFFDNTDKQINESVTSAKKSLSIGLGSFRQDGLKIAYLNNKEKTLYRMLTNLEIRGIFESFHFLLEYFHFNDDLIDLSNDEFANSGGYSLLGEYFLFNAFEYSIYARIEDFDRWNDSSKNYHQRASTIGFNHFINAQKLRLGFSAQKLYKNKWLNIDDESKFNLYITMDY